MAIKNLLVFCGSSSGNDEIYSAAARDLGEHMTDLNIRLIYGGGQVGLMGILSDSVMKFGGKSTGVIPNFLRFTERANDRLTELITVESMHERKEIMLTLADAVMAIPGGFGTLDELFECLTWSQLGLHQKPIGLLNLNCYFNPLLEMMDKMVKEGFLKKNNRDLVRVSDDIEDLILKLESYTWNGEEKWLKNKLL